jgi:HK97 family phage portal protein
MVKKNFFQRIWGAIKGGDIDYRSEGQVNSLLTNFGNVLFQQSGNRSNAERLQGITYSAVSAIGDSFSAVQVRLYRRTAKGKEEVLSHPALDMLNNPNPLMTGNELKEDWVSQLVIGGDVFWAFVLTDNSKTILYPLSPEAVRVVPNEKGTDVARYEYPGKGGTIKFSPTQIIHSKTFNPINRFRGMGSIQAAAYAIDNDLAASVYNQKFFENSARPDIVVVLEEGTTLDPDDLERLKAEWTTKFGGISKSWKPVFIQGLVKDVKSLGLSQKDMEFAKLKEITRDEILSILRVPKTIVAITDDVNRANAETSDYVFAERTIKPKLRRYVDMLNIRYLPLFKGTSDMFFQYDDPTPENRELSLAEDTQLVNAGILTINEIREKRGLVAVQNGDVPMVNASLVPLGEPMPTPIKQTVAEVKSAVKKVIGNMDMQFEIKGEMAHKAMIRSLNSWFGKAIKVSNLLFKDMEAEILANLPKALKSVKDTKFSKRELLDAATAVKNWITKFLPIIYGVQKQEGSRAMVFLGLSQPFDVDSSSVQKLIKEQVKRLGKGVVRETIILVGNTLADGVAAGEGIPDLRKRVMTAFDDMSKYRAERIARSEVITASNAAQVEAWKQSGVVSGKIWYTALDERVCEFCAEMHGQKIGLDDTFLAEGDELTGKKGGTYSTDYRSIEEPALHPNCRCTLLPDVITTRSMKIKPKTNYGTLVERQKRVVKTQIKKQDKELDKLREEINDAIREES